MQGTSRPTRLVRDLGVELRRRPRFERHLERMAPDLRELRGTGHSNANALAILAVESFFRPRPARVLEYAAWILLSLVGRRWAGRLSVGTSQAQVRHWRSLGVIDDERFSFERLARVRSLRANYLVCLRFLSVHRATEVDDERLLAWIYAGDDRRHYEALLARAKDVIGAR
jgi:hypothetical protein